MNLQVITANRLREGDVVYLTDTGIWSVFLNKSLISSDAAVLQAMQAQAEADVEARKIVAPYLMEVVEIDGILQPLSTRETIRASGPTIRADFRSAYSKQSGPNQSHKAA